MSTYWDLTSLYTSFDDPKMEHDLAQIKEGIKTLKTWFQDNRDNQAISDSQKITHMMTGMTTIKFKSSRYEAYARLEASTNTTHQVAQEKLNRIEAVEPDIKELDIMFQSYLSHLDELDNLLHTSAYLEEHAFILHEMVAKQQHSLDSDTELIIAKMKNTGSTAWTKLHQQLLSNLQVNLPAVDGLEEETKPISAVRNMAYAQEQKVRKRAYESELKAYEKITLPMAACINGIKGEAITQSHLRDFDSPLDMSLFYSRMDPSILDALLETMREALPLIRKFMKKKAHVLGHDKGMPWYDLYAPLGENNALVSYEEAKKIVYDNFHNFNPDLAHFAQKAFDKNWVDVEPRAGKRGGAFCYNLPIGESRVLLNYDSALSDVITLAHELGHGYHGHCLKDEHLYNRRYTMPIAETASTFCETIIIKSAMAHWDDEKRFAILHDQVTRYMAIIMDIYSRFLFEDALFKQREHATLSVSKLCDMMASAQKEAYGDGLDHTYNHPYMWVNKVHYYYVDRNYYNFPYAFGLLFAKGLYAMYEKEGDSFLPKYDTLLKATGKNTIYDIGQRVGIDLTDVAFFKGGLDMIRNDVNMLLKLMETMA